MIFKVLDQLENLILVWKCVETEFLSVSCLNNLERLYFVIRLHTKYFRPRPNFAILVKYMEVSTIHQKNSGKRKKIKSTRNI